MWKEFALLAVAGAVGTIARYGLSSWIQRNSGLQFPWGTFAVNMIGCFLFGLIWSFGENRSLLSRQTRFVLLTGFMGAFTTFSTFAFETAGLLRASQWALAAANSVGQLVMGILVIFAGLAIGRLL